MSGFRALFGVAARAPRLAGHMPYYAVWERGSLPIGRMTERG
ncbi:hypothetical protein NG2371_05764 [Nocardia gamkensis]|nr:hypothetical protein [Nocardia gamkensis]